MEATIWADEVPPSRQSRGLCSEWCLEQSETHCTVRSALLYGMSMRCGFRADGDSELGTCGLVVGRNLQKVAVGGAQPVLWAQEIPCEIDKYLIEACPPDEVEDPCTAAGRNVTAVRHLCEESLATCEDAMENLDDCIFDVCAFDDLEFANLTDFVCEATPIIITSTFPPPPPPVTPPPPLSPPQPPLMTTMCVPDMVTMDMDPACSSGTPAKT